MEIENVKIKSVGDLFNYIRNFNAEGYKQKTGRDIDPDMKSMIQRIKNGDEYLKNVKLAINNQLKSHFDKNGEKTSDSGNINLKPSEEIEPDGEKFVMYSPKDLILGVGDRAFYESLLRSKYDYKYKVRSLEDDYEGSNAATFLKFLFLLDPKQIEKTNVIFYRIFSPTGKDREHYLKENFLKSTFDKNRVGDNLVEFICLFWQKLVIRRPGQEKTNLKEMIEKIISISDFENLKNYFSDEGLIVDETYAKKFLDNMNVADYRLVELFSGLKNCKPENKIKDGNLRKAFYADLVEKSNFFGDGAITMNNIIPDDIIESDELKLVIAKKNKQQLYNKIRFIIHLAADNKTGPFFDELKSIKDKNIFLDKEGNVVNLPEKMKIKVNCDASGGENLAINNLDKESDNPLVIIDSLLMSKLHGYVLGDEKSWLTLFSYIKDLSKIGFVLKPDQKDKKYFIPQNNDKGLYMGIRYDALIEIMKQAAEDKKISSLDDLKTFLSLFDLTGFNDEYKKSFLDACIEVIKNNSLKSSDFGEVVELFEKTFGDQNERLRWSLLKKFDVVDKNIIDTIKIYSMPIHDFSDVKLCADIEQLGFISTAFQKLKIELQKRNSNDEKKKYILSFISEHIAYTKVKIKNYDKYKNAYEKKFKASESDIAVACVIFGEENIKNIFDGIKIPKYKQEDKNKEKNQKLLDKLEEDLKSELGAENLDKTYWKSDFELLKKNLTADSEQFKKYIDRVKIRATNALAYDEFLDSKPSSGVNYDLFTEKMLEGKATVVLDKDDDLYITDTNEYKNRLNKLEEIRLKEIAFKSKIKEWKSLTYYNNYVNYVELLINKKLLHEKTKDVADKDLGDFLIKLMEETENVFINRQALEKLVADNEFDKNRMEYLNLLAVNKLKLNSNDYENNLRYFKENTIDVEKNKSANKKLLNDTFEKEDSPYKKCFDAKYSGEEVANYFKKELGEPNKTGDEDYGLYALTHGFGNEFLTFFNDFKEKLDTFIILKEEIEKKYNKFKVGFDKLEKDYEARINSLKSEKEIEKEGYKQAVDLLNTEFLADLIEVRKNLTAEKTAEGNRKENQKSLDILVNLKSSFEEKYGQLPKTYDDRINDLSSDNWLKEKPNVYEHLFLVLKGDIENEMAGKEIEKLNAEERENNKNANKDKLAARENEWKELVAYYMEIEDISSEINKLKKDESLYMKPEDYDNAINGISLLIQNEADTRQKKLDNKTKNIDVLKTFKIKIDEQKQEFKDLVESFVEEKKDDLDENNKKLEDTEPYDYQLFIDGLKNELSNKITTEKQNIKNKNKEINEPRLNALRQDEKYNDIKNSREQAVNILQNMLYLASDEFDSELSKSKDDLDHKLKVLNDNKKKLNNLVKDKKYDEVKGVFNKDIENLQKILSDPQDDFDKPSSLNDFDNKLKALKDKLDDELKNNEQKKENMKKNQEALDAIYKKTEYAGIITKANIITFYNKLCTKTKLEKPVEDYKKLLADFEKDLEETLENAKKMTDVERKKNIMENNDYLRKVVKEYENVLKESDYKSLEDSDIDTTGFAKTVNKNLIEKAEGRLKNQKYLKKLCERYKDVIEDCKDGIKNLESKIFELDVCEFDEQISNLEVKLIEVRKNKNLEALDNVIKLEKYKDVIQKDEIQKEINNLKNMAPKRSIKNFEKTLEDLKTRLENELKILADDKQKEENKKENKKALDAIWNNKDYQEIINKPDVKFLYDSLCDDKELEKPVDEYKKLLADFENKLKQRVEKEKNLTQDNKDNNKKANNNYLEILIKNNKFKDVCREEDYKNLKDSDLNPEEFKSLTEILNKKLEDRLENKKALDEFVKNKNYEDVIKKYNNEIKDLEKKLFDLTKDEFNKQKEILENNLLDEIKTENLGMLDAVIENEKYKKVIKEFETRVNSLYSKASTVPKKEFGEKVKELENDLEEFFKLENSNSLDDIINADLFKDLDETDEIKNLKQELSKPNLDNKTKNGLLGQLKDKLFKRLEEENLKDLKKITEDEKFKKGIEINKKFIDKLEKSASKTKRKVFNCACVNLKIGLTEINFKEALINEMLNFIPEPEKKKELEGWLKDKELRKKILTDKEVSTALDEYQKNLKVAISGDIDAIAKLLGLEKKDIEGKNVHEILNLVCEKNKSHKRQRNIATGITAGFVLTGAGTGAVSVLAISGKLAATLAIPFGAPAAALIVLSIVGLSFTLYKRSKVISTKKEIDKANNAKTEIIKGKEGKKGIFSIVEEAKNKPNSELGNKDKNFFGPDL